MAKIKRLFWDIETSLNVVLAFRAGYDVVINHDAVVAERKVICIGYKWEGDRKPTVLRWDRNQDDRSLLVAFSKVIAQADEAVAHFGDRFDLPWLRTRILLHRLDPIPFLKTIDTKMWASRNFYFNSNKLDYLAKVMGFGGKLKTDFDLWKDIQIKKCPKALNKMCRYCGMDVVRLEQVFGVLSQYVQPKSHQGVFNGSPKWSCPSCGSLKLRYRRKRVSAAGTVSHVLTCRSCRRYHTVSNSTHSEFLHRGLYHRKEVLGVNDTVGK